MLFDLFKKKQVSLSQETSAAVEADVEMLMQEAVSVINDFLNIGYYAVLCGGDYEGHIIFTPDARNGFKTGFVIIMSNAEDLSTLAYTNSKALAEDPQRAEKYYDFVDKYQKYYNPADGVEKGYVYKTYFTVPSAYVQRDQLKEKLIQRIAQNCPLADFSGNMLFTKNVSRY